ncbi:hypothetical protein D187_001128 [Cystobacter fuscus DSM 2262]|uniref:Lipoprotein n=1 Tax=Cystobacter fuscus (strain ATCC 25194 / DSM 2262 / NBRC 100088 / M29) TaxID=1242864 RepID=S9PAA8_CYSF2|nr:putative metal-binding motif-containing protein [Cystobacter fuscus]EPX61345.1 hypothetical protein D187_001128 [Cystobacter fuscus DSM 2262]
MSSRLVLLVGLVACLSIGCRDQGAVKLTISFPNFKPGCIRVSVKDAQGAGEERSMELQEQLAGKKRGEKVTVAAFREEGWGSILTVTATAFEQQCSDKPVFTASDSVDVGRGVSSAALTLVADDTDEDGYVSKASGGTDCNDGEATVHPGQAELCNTRDDNCDGKPDEGFEKVGQQCGTGSTCQTWACDAVGAMSCQDVIPQWYRDQDGDGEGDPQQGLSQCAQPVGYVNNDRDCDDKRKERYSTATELCNGVNDNCDDVVDEGFNTGATCTGELNCGGTIECVTTTQSACKVVTSTWYPDGDKDGHGATGAGTKVCGDTAPSSYYVASSDDCDDTKNNVYTGAPEFCDALDNDCDNQKDEDFDVGVACDAGNQCTGAKECAPGGKSTQCKSTTPPTQYYVDNDFDQYGQNTPGPLTCSAPGAGYATQSGDCDDGNRFTHPNAAEVCDLADNDCDTEKDEGDVCPTTPAWTNYPSPSPDSETWYSVALYGNGGVWVAGGDNFHQRKPTETSFQDLSTCTAGASVYSVATTPGSGDALLGGNDGFMARYDPTSEQCVSPGKKSVDTHIKGATAFPLGNDIEAHFVGFNTNGPDKGRAFRVITPQGTSYDTQSVSEELTDVHGLSQDTLFAVGGANTSSIYRFDKTSGNWSPETIPNGGGTLLGVWVVNPKLAYAVGNNGTMYGWNGSAWSKFLPTPPGDHLSSVVAFGSRSIYISTLTGRVYHYNGSAWTKAFDLGSVTPGQFRDIAANNPGDIWVVGNKGNRYHWPQ